MGLASTCALPLARGQRRVGAISVGSSYPRAFPEDKVRVLSLVADQISLAIDAAANFYLSRQAQDRLKLILDLTNQVVSNPNFQELLRTISASVRRVMRCDAAAIMLPEPDGKHLRVHALDFPDGKGFFTEEVLIPIEGSMPGETLRSGKPWVLNRLDAAEVPPEMYANGGKAHHHAYTVREPGRFWPNLHRRDERLHRLPLSLTADREKAEQCFVSRALQQVGRAMQLPEKQRLDAPSAKLVLHDGCSSGMELLVAPSSMTSA